MNDNKTLTQEQYINLLNILKTRFMKNMNRHQSLTWDEIETKLASNPEKLWSLQEMESSSGEPDVVSFDPEKHEFIFIDCSPESPKGRRSLCYDREALESRKEFKPASNALETAAQMGIELLTEIQYRELQKTGVYDTKTSSWVKTPPEIRKHGGALFCDRRYNAVFTYHNGAESYYAARGFRGMLKV